jgi:hypothetical protein
VRSAQQVVVQNEVGFPTHVLNNSGGGSGRHVGHWLLNSGRHHVGHWLLATGYWLLAIIKHPHPHVVVVVVVVVVVLLWAVGQHSLLFIKAYIT